MGKLSKNTIQQLFNKYDKNKNGVIEKGELTECFKEIIGSIEEMSPEELEKIVNEGMKNFDENANGVLSDILSSECLVAVGLVISIPCPLPISIKASPNMVVCEFTFIVSGTSIFLFLILTGMQV